MARTVSLQAVCRTRQERNCHRTQRLMAIARKTENAALEAYLHAYLDGALDSLDEALELAMLATNYRLHAKTERHSSMLECYRKRVISMWGEVNNHPHISAKLD